MVAENFGINELTMVGDRGMITNARIKELRTREGMDWITALRAPAIAELASDDGPLQMSLFDIQNFAEITHPDYPGERLICCRNPSVGRAASTHTPGVARRHRQRTRQDRHTRRERETARSR